MRLVHLFCPSGKIPQLILFFLFLFSSTFSFSQSSTDTLELTRLLRDKGKVKEAYRLVKRYYNHHPGDFNSTWLYAQSSYLAHHLNKSKALYKKAIKLSPRNLYLQLDYAKNLVNLTDYKEAKILLDKYLTYDSTNSQALTALARISFWQGDFNKALSTLNKIQPVENKSGEVTSMRQDILIAKSPWIGLMAGYLSDDQPMQDILTQLDGGVFLHPLSTLHFTLQSPLFITGGARSRSFWLHGDNKAVFGRAGMVIDASLGLVKFPSNKTIDWTGNIGIDKTFIRHLVLSLAAERAPYFYTISSISTPVIENHGSLRIGWNDLQSWNGEASFNLRQYPVDNNYLTGFSAWGFTPPLKYSVFELRIGYAYSYSNSQKNHFVPEESVTQITTNFDPSASISGIYDPYFTPKDQSIHSLLAGISILPGKIIKIILNGNFGVYANAMIPYYYGYYNTQSTVVIMNGSVNKRFFPVNVSGVLSISASKTIHLKAEYIYNKTYYFNNHYAGLGLTINFPNGRQEK